MQNKSWIGKTLALAILPMALGSAWAQTAPQLTPDEMAKAKQIYGHLEKPRCPALGKITAS